MLASSGALACSSVGARKAMALAIGQCETLQNAGPDSGRTVCRAGITLSQAMLAYANQQSSLWCWAATIHMVFRHYGYFVAQETIVSTAYGGSFNWAASGSVISRQLNRQWLDAKGRTFHAKLEGLYDHDERVAGITNSKIVDALKNGQPLVYGNKSHAMLLGMVDYYKEDNITFRAAGFADPWPGKGLRGAEDLLELVAMGNNGHMRYLALPVISGA